ncbi:MAG: hypothetical protein HY729_06900 [Candidatus Rokubacteria bacterium]|nr:hypothetical protein [Candidatus Rokubacteria bacterium]
MRRFILLVGLIGFATGASGCAAGPPQPRAYYPAREQSAEQVWQDQAECRAWATHQTGFYERTYAACMGSRGYSLK